MIKHVRETFRTPLLPLTCRPTARRVTKHARRLQAEKWVARDASPSSRSTHFQRRYICRVGAHAHVNGRLCLNRFLLSRISSALPHRCASVPPSKRSIRRNGSGSFPAPIRRTILGWSSLMSRLISRSSSCGERRGVLKMWSGM